MITFAESSARSWLSLLENSRTIGREAPDTVFEIEHGEIRYSGMYAHLYLTLTCGRLRIIIPAHHEPVCFSSHLRFGTLV